MERERAISLAQDWVRDRYPMVPPVAMAFELTPEFLEQIGGSDNFEGEWQASVDKMGNWFVGFFCSWDTDELGMPEKLAVNVNHKTGIVELEFD